jgi:rod shape determining protein RodA
MVSRKDWREFDWPLLLCALAAAGFGVAMIFSTIGGFSEGASPLKNIAVRQALYVGIGLLGFFILVNIDYKLVLRFSPIIYAGVILLLIMVAVLPQSGPIYSPNVLGSRRWINFPFGEIQPSEFAKIAVALMLAKYMSEHIKDSKKLSFLLISLAIALVPFVIVFKEPDLGSALVILAIWLVMVIAARPRWLYLGLGFALMIPASVFAWNSGLVQDYQKNRLLAFLDPSAPQYILGEGRNLIVARSAIGSGGIFGQGFMHGDQSQGGYLSISHSDYIFSVVGEEFGFAGCIALIVLLYIIISRCFSVASRSKDEYGQLLGVGIGGMLLVQTFVNVGMNIGILPVTGIPLPFVSAGGSSLIAILLGLGILQSVAIYRKSGVYDYTDYEYDRIVSPNYRPSAREQRAAARGR